MKFVVYEVWTKSRIVEAKTQEDAVIDYEIVPIEGLSLCNWHAVPVTDTLEGLRDDPHVGALNYRQEVH